MPQKSPGYLLVGQYIAATIRQQRRCIVRRTAQPQAHNYALPLAHGTPNRIYLQCTTIYAHRQRLLLTMRPHVSMVRTSRSGQMVQLSRRR